MSLGTFTHSQTDRFVLPFNHISAAAAWRMQGSCRLVTQTPPGFANGFVSLSWPIVSTLLSIRHYYKYKNTLNVFILNIMCYHIEKQHFKALHLYMKQPQTCSTMKIILKDHNIKRKHTLYRLDITVNKGDVCYNKYYTQYTFLNVSDYFRSLNTFFYCC